MTINPDGRRYSEGDVLRTRATHASHRARLRGLGLSVGIAIAFAGCAKETPQEQAQEAAQRAQRDEDIAFRECTDEVVGAFSAASIDVVRECRAHAASGAEAQRATTVKQGVVHDGPTGKAGDAQRHD